MNAIEAKEFLASRIVDQARLENVEFSEVERKMLFYSEINPSLPDMDAAAKEFDENYNMFPYEKLVSSLVCNAHRRDRTDPALAQKWKDARRTLRWEDHYINVMLKRGMASATRTRDLLLYVALGVLVVAVIFVVIALGH
jgi:hypothetical protein